jgi:hypothetical protein
MVNEGERHLRPGATFQHGTENRNSFHFAPVELAIEKETKAVGPLGGWVAQEMKGPRETGGVVGDVIFFEFDGLHRLFSGKGSQGDGQELEI